MSLIKLVKNNPYLIAQIDMDEQTIEICMEAVKLMVMHYNM